MLRGVIALAGIAHGVAPGFAAGADHLDHFFMNGAPGLT
jgi:hypothetical protein